MSNLFKYTKRVLTSVLAAAVVLTAIPSTAFGAEPLDEDLVEAVDVQEEAVAEVGEEATTTDGTGNEEEVIIEGEEETPDTSAQDVELVLALSDTPTNGHVGYAYADQGDISAFAEIIDLSTKSQATAVGSDESAPKWTTSKSASLGYVRADSALSDGYTVYLVAEEGYDFKATPVKSVEYYDFSTVASDDWNVPEVVATAHHTLTTPSASTFTVTPVSGNPELVRVTFAQSFLQMVERGSYYSDYSAARADKADLRFNPQIKITADVAKGIKSKEFPMSSLTLSPDIAGSDMHKDSIAVANRTVTYDGASTSSVNAESRVIAGLGSYITGKTIEDKMITVTYTPLAADAVFDKAFTTTATSSIDSSDDKYAKYLATPVDIYTPVPTTTEDYQNLNPKTLGWYDTNSSPSGTTNDVYTVSDISGSVSDPLPDGVVYEGDKSNRDLTVTSDTTIQSGKNYYQLNSTTYYTKSTEQAGLSVWAPMADDYVTGKANLAVYVDGSLADTKYKTLTVDPNTYVKGVYKADGTTPISGTKFEFGKDNDFVVELPPTSDSVATNTRTVKEIVIKENNDKSEVKITTPGTSVNPKYTYTLSADAVDDDVTMTITTQEVVSVANVAPGVILYDTTGKQITGSSHIDSGTQNFEFEVVPTKGKEIDKVQYSFEGDTAWNDATASGNNYKIPVKIEKGINFKVTEKGAETKKDVTINNVYGATAWGTGTGEAVEVDAYTEGIVNVWTGSDATVDGNKFAGTDWEIAEAATESKYYYFTVKTDAGYVPIAKYFFGTPTTDYTKYKDAKLVSSDEEHNLYVYRTNEAMPINTAKVGLCIRAKAAIKINKPANPMVVTSFGDSVIVPTGETYSFTLQTKAGKGTVAVKKVTYTADGTTPTAASAELTLSGGEYTLGTSVLSGATAPIKLFVQTEETITNGFTVKYSLANDSKEYPSLTGDTGNQKLTLCYGDVTDDLTAEFKTTDRVPAVIASYPTAGSEDKKAADKDSEGMWAVSADATDTSKKDIVTVATHGSAVKVTAAKLGTDTITTTLVQNNTNGDKKIYKGASLPVEVKATWTDLELIALSDYTDDETPVVMAQATTTATDDDNHVVEFGITGTYTRTGEKALVDDYVSGITSIKYSFDPDNKDDNVDTQTYRMGATNVKFDSMSATLTKPDDGVAWVRAKDTTTPNVKLVAEVAINGATKPVQLERDFTIIGEGSYAPYSSYKYAGGEEEYVSWAVDASDKIEAPSTIVNPTLELKSGGINSIVIDYPIYKQKVATGATMPNKAAFDVAVAAGDYEAVTSGLKVTATTPEKMEAYATASVSGTKVTITAAKKGLIPVTITATLDGVVVAENIIGVEVVDNLPSATVTLLLDDVGTYTLNEAKNKSTPVQQELSASAYTGRKNSIIEPNNNVAAASLFTTGDGAGAGVKSIRGIKFIAETANTTFTLPKQSDFNVTKVGKGRVLVGWDKVASYSGLTPVGVGGACYYPGEAVTVTDGDTYMPIWADEYGFDADAVTAAGDYLGLGRKLYNALNATKDAEGKITAYGELSVVTDAATPAKGTTGELAAGNTMPLAIKLVQRIPYTAELKAKVKAAEIADFPTATTKDEYKTGTDGLTLTVGGTEKARLTAASGAISIASNAEAITNTFNELLNVTASWTDSKSGNVFKTCEIPVDVIEDQKYTLAFNSENPTSLLVDQSNNNKLKVDLKKDGTLVTNDYPSADTKFAPYGFTYKAVPEGVVEITAVDKADIIGQASKDADWIEIVPLKAGTVTLTATVVDANGLNKSATATLEVKDNGVAFTITDVNTNTTVAGTDADPLQALAYNATDASTKNYTIVGTPAVTFTGVVGDGTVVTKDANTKFLTDGKTLQITTKSGVTDLSDEGCVVVSYKKNGDTSGTEFERTLSVDTYFDIVLAKGTYEIYNGDKKVVGPDGTTAADGKVRVTMANRVNVGTETSPSYVYKDIDLSAFSAKDPAKAKTWIGWKETNKSIPTGQKYTYKEKIEKLTAASTDGTSDLKSGAFTLDPVMAVNPITKAVIGQTTIRLSNETGVPLAGTAEKINEKNIVLNVEPYDTKDTITIVPEKNKSALFQGKAGGMQKKIGYEHYNRTGSGTDPDPYVYTKEVLELGFTAGKVALPYGVQSQDKDKHDGAVIVDNTKKERTDNFNIAAITGAGTSRAGTIEFDVQSTSSGLSLGKLTVVINGYDAVDDQYLENGVAVVNDSRLVAGETWFFNEKGNHVDGDAIITKADGSKIAIDNGALVPANTLVTLTGDYAGTYYVKASGTIAAGEIFKLSGVDRLFRENGTLVTYSDKDVVDGKIKVGNVTYKIDPTTSEAKPDKKMVNAKFTWTTKKPAKFDRKSALPTSDWEISYNLEGETTPLKATGTVTAVADPADYATVLDLRSVTFTFTASESDLAGFFSDSKGEKALTATPAVWTYKFSGTSDIGSGGGIEVVGFEEGQEFKFTGGAIKPPVEVWDNDLGEKLVLGVDYSLSYKNNTKITTDSSKMPTLTVVGKGNYAGKNVTRTFKIVNPIEGETGLTTTVKTVVLGWTTTPVYNGEEWYPDTITVDGNGFSHLSGDSYTTDTTANYVFTFSNNVDAGTATVGVTGQDGKTKKKTFKINKVDLSKVPTANLEISPADAEWTVKGAVPATTVTYTPEGGSAITLVEGQDYTLKVNYADKKKNVADGNTVTITGKGANFTKKATSTETFKIDPYTITDASLLEVVAPAGAKVKTVKTTVVDKNDVKIDKKNYTVNVYDSTSTLLAPTASLTAGQTYKVEVVAPPTGNIDGSASFEFVAAADMSKAKVTLSKDLKKNGVAYTGEAIDITNIQSGELIKNLFTTGDITVEYKNPSTKKYEKLTWDEDFEVVGYQNNVKKGTMTVFIRAKEESTKVSGVKNFKIKISAKTMQKAQ